ncbi:peptidylprolyl isomerase [Candidatus Woesearchaeota archaeon]|nr:peptidylprolyl isomerase [Candidatus Woesearchaeota archaeon]
MQISTHKVVHFHYTLTNDDGDVLDTSRGHDPLAYIQGLGSIIPGLENAMAGRSVGDRFIVSVPPEEGYGPFQEDRVQSVPRSAFEGVDELLPGMQFQAQSDEGAVLVTVIDIRDDLVLLNGNHPMAGMNLNFDVEVTEVREATHEELDHGHVYGAGGHHH